MKTIATLILAGSVIALAGCSQQDPNKREAGKWKNEVELETLKLTGVPAEYKAQAAQLEAQAKQQFASQVGLLNAEECLSKEGAAKENIAEEIAQGMTGSPGANCKFDKNSVANGKIELVGKCSMQGKEMNVSVTGTTTPKKVDAVMAINAEASGSGATLQPGMEMKMKVSRTQIGSCG
jgi:Protein of unknown function (DUF3617)